MTKCNASLEATIELPIARSNSYKKDEMPVLYGNNIFVTITFYGYGDLVTTVHECFDQFDHSCILGKDNPLYTAYKENFAANGIDLARSRVFVLDKDPTLEDLTEYFGNLFYGYVHKTSAIEVPVFEIKLDDACGNVTKLVYN